MKPTEARKLLGIGRDANPQAIKKAFRQLAMLWHPDRNPAPEAHEMFARLSAACDLLLAPFAQAGEDGDSNVSSAPSRGPDRNQDIELSVEQLCLGGKADVVLESSVQCQECEGQGFHERGHNQLCTHCQGTGRVRNGRSSERCEDCDGRGYTRRTRCLHCDGTGREISRRILVVTIPPGLLPGDELRLEGEGYAPPIGKGAPGDLRLRIQYKPDGLYLLEGSHLVLECPVSAFILLGGGRVTVPTPFGERQISLEAGLADGREQWIPGAGIPARGKRPAGDLRVHFVPVLPTVTTSALVKHYRAIQAEIDRMPLDTLPEQGLWERRPKTGT
ncbi:MAG: DnaJ domain-containing protein [Azoarcus sp.]|nr:DnaJ domain-containing protein [Azoarcus sp.]